MNRTRLAWRHRIAGVGLLLALAMAMPSSLVAQDPEEPPSLGQALLYHLQFATDISNGFPLDNGTVFPDDAPRVLTLVGWDFAPFLTELGIRLYVGDRLVMEDVRYVITEQRAGYIFNYQPGGRLPVGTYTAELYYNGVIDEVATFEVVPAGSLPDPGEATGAAEGDAGQVPYVDPSDLLIVTRASVLRENMGSQADAVLQAAAQVGSLADLEADGATRDEPDEAIAEVHRLLGTGPYRYLLILGNDDVVPFARLPNPLGDSEGEALAGWELPAEWLPSDDPYTDLDGDEWGVPDLPVARIPSSEDAELLLAQLGTTVPPDGGGYVLTNQVWRGLTAAIVETMDDEIPVQTWYAPPMDPEEFVAGDGQESRYVHIDLHGIGVTTDEWSSDVVAWEPQTEDLDGEWWVGVGDQIAVVDLAGASSRGIVNVGACFGAWTLDTTLEPRHKTADTSLALGYLKAGTRAFIGSTHIAYGFPNTPSGPYVGGDGFSILFWRELLAGASPIDAFHLAKIRIAEVIDEAIAAGAPEAAALNLKTLHQMVYLGRP